MKYDDAKQKILSNPEIKQLYDETQPEYDGVNAKIEARKAREAYGIKPTPETRNRYVNSR